MKRQLCSELTAQKTVDLMISRALRFAQSGQDLAETGRIFC